MQKSVFSLLTCMKGLSTYYTGYQITGDEMRVAAPLLALSSYALASCSPSAGASDPRYVTEAVSYGDIRDIVPAIGEIRPAGQVEVGAEITGRIIEILADFDDEVEEGQLLARIDPAPYEAGLAQAQASLRTANARVRAASAERDNAARELDRARQLQTRGTAPASLVEEYEFDLVAHEAQLAQARAEVELAESRVEQARIDLARTEIRSPINGFIQDRLIEVGQTVSAAQSTPTLFIVSSDLTNVVIEALVAENDIGRVEEGLEVRFTVEAYPGEEFYGISGPVRRSPRENGRFVSYPVLIEASDPEQRLLPGMTAAVEFVHDEARAVTRVRIEALSTFPVGWCPDEVTDEDINSLPGLQTSEMTASMRCAAAIGTLGGQIVRAGQRRLFVLEDGRPVMHRVRVGAEDDRYVEIVDGDIRIGDEVLIRDRERY
ncbi:efflux RND transporter periplasmic adaptor subunit [Hyphobacterium sp. HN65]|uniref:Efflux RND transporter periplasmic adaptor subunit n=1 Tax=Hyphobacterium lacteum TaxID=3116575 RepID=A0ABU7LPF5_9PROT|nr:efflux RND transporter periplasmic adaptor subunit [Hyphobacterium sp. HN65]MEE2525805.1 efflux RND transporter periplasmic adaptor subunit [Hyphobacterium sp. HN65]